MSIAPVGVTKVFSLIAVVRMTKTLRSVDNTIRLDGVFNRTPLSNVAAAGMSKDHHLLI